jgi:hypothetical protein
MLWAIVIVGVLTLVAVGVFCFAAYKIRAESFEVTAGIWRLVSLSIKIKSPAEHASHETGRPPEQPALGGSRPSGERAYGG